MEYERLLFSELRLIAVSAGDAAPDNASLVKAMTANEELKALGYALSPRDIIALSVSPDIDGFVSRVREYIGDVKADPMYPGFPSQVMEMDEAVFRFHQLVHYFTTYGMESILNTEVIRGWLPPHDETERLAPDDTLLAAKTIALIDREEMYSLPYRRILSKTERMDDKERLIVSECVDHLSPEQITSVEIRFKQNLLYSYSAVFFSAALSSGAKLDCLHSLCQHTGDVWKCMDYALTRAGFSFKTSQKRLTVKLLESYPSADFKANLILSNKKAERTLLMLKHLDFNEYSRSPEHMQAVADLRGGALRSWEARAKYLVTVHDPRALEYYSERPGMLLRHMTFLMRNGYDSEQIYAALAPTADSLKTQTLVSLANHFFDPSQFEDKARSAEAATVSGMVKDLLSGRLSAAETPLRGKKVYVDMDDFDLDLSIVKTNDKSAEGGYIRSGLAYRIPENINRLRFFIYWNDEQKVDVDLHASAETTDGKQINIGWNAEFKSGALVFSGDITHSDAAEYFDIDLSSAKKYIDNVSVNINLFSGYDTFAEVDECFVGAMAVGRVGEEVKLYDPKNCFFTHYLRGKYKQLHYGYVDVTNRVIIFDGIPNTYGQYYSTDHSVAFPVSEYLRLLFEAQSVQTVTSREEADAVLVMGKPSADCELSLIDHNFFMDY